MTNASAPRFATWLLERLGPRYRNESLVGDLLEEYQQGRTPAWYWRQTLAAICIGRAASLRRWVPRRSRLRNAAGQRRSTPLKRLLSVFAVTALSAGTLTWASAAPLQLCTIQGRLPQASSSIIPAHARLDGHAGAH